MSSDLFVRVSAPYSSLQMAIELIADKCEKCVVYEHNEKQSNVHVHVYLRGCSVSTDTLKNYIRRSGFSGSGNKQWSFKRADDDGCITYMSKGVLDPMYVKGYTVEEIGLKRGLWEDRVPTTLDRKGDTQVTQYSMALEVEKLVRDKLKNRFGVIPTEEIYELCVRQSIVVCHKHRKGFNEFSLRTLVHTAYCNFENCQEAFVSKLVQKFFS